MNPKEIMLNHEKNFSKYATLDKEAIRFASRENIMDW